MKVMIAIVVVIMRLEIMTYDAESVDDFINKDTSDALMGDDSGEYAHTYIHTYIHACMHTHRYITYRSNEHTNNLSSFFTPYLPPISLLRHPLY